MSVLEDQIQALAPWQYNIALPDGTCIMANGRENVMDQQWQLIKHSIPSDLTGWKVFEIAGRLAVYLNPSLWQHICGRAANCRRHSG